ncbi:unnamed protein product [Phytophthora fragariaefolia]|uniref:Unnamed protein product n=1 Tax=Phytophthora fragariaefolia TaxID=1490495 RepID=A0A9W6WRH2_9STRA|nr:unnamed protein product [Phytophthora fragariaefolia]
MELAMKFCAFAIMFLPSESRPTFVARIPNGNGVSGVAALGHVIPSGGGATNAFGQAFETAGHQWTSGLCQADSDGDGATNGEELGDPCCTWSPSAGFADSPPSQAPTHPGVPNRFTAAQLAVMTCGGEADLASIASSSSSASSADLLTSSNSQASTSLGSGSSSSSFDDVMAPDDHSRLSPGPKIDDVPPTPAASGAERLQDLIAAACVAVVLVLV